MKVGYGLISCQAHADDKRSEAERYQDAIELAIEAESSDTILSGCRNTISLTMVIYHRYCPCVQRLPHAHAR